MNVDKERLEPISLAASVPAAKYQLPAKISKTKTRVKPAKRINHFLLYLFLIILAAIFMLPVAWLLINSLKLNIEFKAYPIKIFPQQPIWSNYPDALSYIPYFTYAGRSVFLAGTYTVLVVISSAFAGFGFARHRAPGRDFLFLLVISMIMIPQIVTIIPQFILYSRLGLVGIYWPWVLWGFSGSPFHIFLFRQFFAAFPRELEEAAEIDGCSRPGIFWRIFFPNAGAVIAASSIFAFQWVWGDYFLQTLFLNKDQATLAMKLAKGYVDAKGLPMYTQTLAAVVMYVIPLVVVFFVAQRSIIRGVVTTGLK